MNILTVTYWQNENRDFFVLDIADQPIMSDAVSPEPTLVALQRLAQLSWILGGLPAFAQEMKNCGLSASVKF